MIKKFLFSFVLSAVLLAASGCSLFPAKKKIDARPAAALNVPVMNSFGVSQTPVPPKTPEPAPAPVIETPASSTPDSAASSTAPAAAENAQILIKDFSFSPAELTVAVGATVVWTNGDAISHDIKSAAFNSPLLAEGETFSQKFTAVGTYDFSCGIHPSMKGKIIVK